MDYEKASKQWNAWSNRRDALQITTLGLTCIDTDSALKAALSFSTKWTCVCVCVCVIYEEVMIAFSCFIPSRILYCPFQTPLTLTRIVLSPYHPPRNGLVKVTGPASQPLHFYIRAPVLCRDIGTKLQVVGIFETRQEWSHDHHCKGQSAARPSRLNVWLISH